MAETTGRKGISTSQTYALFNQELGIFVYAIGNPERFGISVEQYNDLFFAQIDDWEPIYLMYKDPQKQTPAVIEKIRREYEKIHKMVKELQRQVKNDKSIAPLTSDERKALGIHTDKETRTPATIPADAPVIVEIGRDFHSTKFQVKNRPYKARLLVKVAYPAAGTEPTESDYQIVEETGRKNFTIIAPSEIAKGTVGYLKGIYFNNRGESGSESRPIQFVVN